MSLGPFPITRRVAVALAAFFWLLAPTGLSAGERFDPASFKAAQDAGKTILVDVTAPWCVTCRQQHPIIDSMVKDPKFSGLVVFEVDFDTQKEVMKRFQVRWQSTLIVFKGAAEVARSTADTDPASVRAMVARGF